MGRRIHPNPDVNRPRDRPGANHPTVNMTRDQLGAVDDPTRVWTHLPDGTVCPRCECIVEAQRWKRDPSQHDVLLAAGTPNQTVCPACRQQEEGIPQGILTLHGGFWATHRDEILHLIRNQEEESAEDNPLERVMALREEADTLVVETTNEKLAQKIGRAIEKAYHGELKFQWGSGNQLVRIDWERAG